MSRSFSLGDLGERGTFLKSSSLSPSMSVILFFSPLYSTAWPADCRFVSAPSAEAAVIKPWIKWFTYQPHVNPWWHTKSYTHFVAFRGCRKLNYIRIIFVRDGYIYKVKPQGLSCWRESWRESLRNPSLKIFSHVFQCKHIRWRYLSNEVIECLSSLPSACNKVALNPADEY